MDTIEFKVKISVQDLNQALALLQQPVITTEEQINEYQDLTFDANDLTGGNESENLQAKVSLAALLVAAKSIKQEKESESDNNG